jgi:hypothetical protein
VKLLRDAALRHSRRLSALFHWAEPLAPRLAPFVRWAGAERAAVWLTPVERVAKSALFDCRMCGQCALITTGMACPMGCGKQMRNGPCGGVRADGHCEIDPAIRCVWVEAGEGDDHPGASAWSARAAARPRRQGRRLAAHDPPAAPAPIRTRSAGRPARPKPCANTVRA